uniref:Uncharacterized protein n=1 Tax=Avena sativa TaxID=4498 RepID=A0ACD6A6U0_AVESA
MLPTWLSILTPTKAPLTTLCSPPHRLVHNLYITAPPATFIDSSILPCDNQDKQMGAGMKRAREEEPVSLALSLTTDSATSTTTSADSSGAPAAAQKKRVRRGRVVATSGEGEFVYKTCCRAFTSFQALGGHRTRHLRGRHGLELVVGVAKAIREKKRSEDMQHECHMRAQLRNGPGARGAHETTPRGDGAQRR